MGVLGHLRSLLGWDARPGGRAQPAPTEALKRERRRGPRVNPRQGTRILVIDDSTTIAVAMRRMLGVSGYQTLLASNAEQGLELARAERPDLIFLDIILPGMNGFSALRALRRDLRTRDLPVILMSGDENAIEQLSHSRIGADGFMPKPFTRSDLYHHIEALLDVEFVPRRRRQGVQQAPAAGPRV